MGENGKKWSSWVWNGREMSEISWSSKEKEKRGNITWKTCQIIKLWKITWIKDTRLKIINTKGINYGIIIHNEIKHRKRINKVKIIKTVKIRRKEN